MIDERSVLAKFIAKRDEVAAGCMMGNIETPAEMGTMLAYNRGLYHGLMVAERLMLDILKDEKEKD